MSDPITTQIVSAQTATATSAQIAAAASAAQNAQSAAWLATNHPDWNQNAGTPAQAAKINADYLANRLPVLPVMAPNQGGDYSKLTFTAYDSLGKPYQISAAQDAANEAAKHEQQFDPQGYYGFSYGNLANVPLSQTAGRYGSDAADAVQGYYRIHPTADYMALTNQYALRQNSVAGTTGVAWQGSARPTEATTNPYPENSAAGIAWRVGSQGGAVNPFLGQTSGAEAKSWNMTAPQIFLPSATNTSVGGYAMALGNVTNLNQVDWGIHTTPTRDNSTTFSSPLSITGSKTVAAFPSYMTELTPGGGVVGFMALGGQRTTSMNDIKYTMDYTTGEFGVYQYNQIHGTWDLLGGGGRAAAQSGMFTFADAYGGGPQTSVVYTQESGGTKLDMNWANASEATKILSNPDLYSRQGAEAYGGVVQLLDNRTLVPNDALSNYSNRYNLANYVDPYGVNLGKAAAPGANIPWSIAPGSPTIQYVNEKGLTGGFVSPEAWMPVGAGNLTGGKTVAGMATTTTTGGFIINPTDIITAGDSKVFTVSPYGTFQGVGGAKTSTEPSIFNPANPLTDPFGFLQQSLHYGLTAGVVTAPLAMASDTLLSNVRGHPEQAPMYSFGESVNNIFNPSASEKSLVSPETYQSHLDTYNTKLGSYTTDLGSYNTDLQKYTANLGTYNKAAVAYSFGFGPDVTPQYNALQISQAQLNAKQGALSLQQGALSEQQKSLEAERTNVGLPPSIFTKIGNVYEGINSAIAPYTTDITGAGKIAANMPDITAKSIGDTSQFPAYENAANLAIHTYGGLTQHPVDIAVSSYGGGELYAGAKATLGWGVAKMAMSDAASVAAGEGIINGGGTLIGNYGRFLSTPTIGVLGGWAEKGIGLIIVGGAIGNVINQPTYSAKGETLGRTILQFGGFGAGMTPGEYNPIEGETPNKFISGWHDFVTKAPENDYAGRGFFSKELELSPLQKYSIGFQTAEIASPSGESSVASYRTFGIISRSGSIGQIEQIGPTLGGVKTTAEGTQFFLGKPTASPEDFRFAPDEYGNVPTYHPTTPLETYLVKTVSPVEEVPKIDLGYSIRGRTSASGLNLKEVTPAIQAVIEGQNIPNARGVAESITSTMKDYNVKLYGSAVQKGVGAEIGFETLGSTPKDLDVMVPGRSGTQMSRPFAEDVVPAINRAAGRNVAELDLSGVVPSIKVGGQKLFDIHNVDATPEELALQGVSPQSRAAADYVGIGIRSEANVPTVEGVDVISYSEQMSRKLSGVIDYSPDVRTVVSKEKLPFGTRTTGDNLVIDLNNPEPTPRIATGLVEGDLTFGETVGKRDVFYHATTEDTINMLMQQKGMVIDSTGGYYGSGALHFSGPKTLNVAFLSTDTGMRDINPKLSSFGGSFGNAESFDDMEMAFYEGMGYKPTITDRIAGVLDRIQLPEDPTIRGGGIIKIVETPHWGAERQGPGGFLTSGGRSGVFRALGEPGDIADDFILPQGTAVKATKLTYMDNPTERLGGIKNILGTNDKIPVLEIKIDTGEFTTKTIPVDLPKAIYPFDKVPSGMVSEWSGEPIPTDVGMGKVFHHTTYPEQGAWLTPEEHTLWHNIDTGKVELTEDNQEFYKNYAITNPRTKEITIPTIESRSPAYSVTGHLAPKYEGRMKDILHYRMGELGNIHVQEMSTNPLTRAGAVKSRAELETWTDLWGPEAATYIRAQSAGKPLPIEIDFGEIRPNVVTPSYGMAPPVVGITPNGFYSTPAPSRAHAFTISPPISASPQYDFSLPSTGAIRSMASLASFAGSQSVAVSKISTSAVSSGSLSSPSVYSVGSSPLASFSMASFGPELSEIYSPSFTSMSPSPSAPSGFSYPSLPSSPSSPSSPLSIPSGFPSPSGSYLPSPPSWSSPPPSPPPSTPPSGPSWPDYPPPPSPPGWPPSGFSLPGGGGGGGGMKRWFKFSEVFSFDAWPAPKLAMFGKSKTNKSNPFGL